MRLLSGVLAFGILLLGGVTAHAAPIYTFGVQGTTDFDTSAIHSFSVDASTSTFSFVKDLDATSPDFLSAVSAGTTFAQAAFIAYDGSIAPLNEIFRYTFAGNVLFTSLLPSGGATNPTETVSLTAGSITRTDGPAAVPEPASILLLGTGLLCAGARRRRQVRAQRKNRIQVPTTARQRT